MISDSGICSRRDADKYIEEGRVSVNGELPTPGQKVTEHDIVLLDDLLVKISKQSLKDSSADGNRSTVQKKTVAKAQPAKAKPSMAKGTSTVASGASSGKGLRPGKYVKYNKYAAARHAARAKAEGSSEKDDPFAKFDKEVVKAALKPEFGKSLKRSAIAQRLASASKSAALRKTSKNNPVNKAKRMAKRNGNSFGGNE